MNCLPDMRRSATRIRLAYLVSAVVSLAGKTVCAATLHVWQDSPNPTAPYGDWATATHVIQDAVDAAADGDAVLVAGGVYSTGGRAVAGTMTNRVAIDKAITVESLMGPEVTVIQGAPAPGGGNGDGAIRCVYLGANAILSGFTLSDGHSRTNGDDFTEQTGGGAWCEISGTLTHLISGTLTNCIITCNSAASAGGGVFRGNLYNCALIRNSAGNGGGAAGGRLYNCLLTENLAASGGGFSALYAGIFLGEWQGALYNCTVSRNSASTDGGGVYNMAIVTNCIVYFNTASNGANYAGPWRSGGHGGGGGYAIPLFNNSCTTPLPTNGVGNISNSPAFVDPAAGDFHLRYGSPGIDTGTDLSDRSTTDLDGNPRPLDGDGDGFAAFDMGAYEFDARSIVPQDWFTRYGLDPADPQVVSGNPDGDAFTTFQEWLADTDPANALSFFYIKDISQSSPAMVSFQSSSNRTYTLWSTPQLDPPDWAPVAGEQTIPGNGGTLTLSDPANAPLQFYRVQVNLP